MKKLESSLALIVLTLALFSRVDGDIKRDCRKQTNVSWAALKKLKAGNFEQDDAKLKCYMRCFMNKIGILGNDDKIDVERALRHLPSSMQEQSRKILNRCKSVSGNDSCDKAFQVAKCYVKNEPEILRNVPFV